MQEAETVYRKGLAACGADGTLLFNLGILLEDLQRPDDAAASYRAALVAAPDLADAHFNLAPPVRGARAAAGGGAALQRLSQADR